MIKFAKITNEKTKVCDVGIGTDVDFYKSIGMDEMDVEQAYNGDWYVKGYAPIQPIDELKAAKIAELKAERDTKEVEPIEYNGHLYDYDDKARDRINAAIIALELAGEGASLEWTCADNTDATVTAADLRNIIAAVAVRSNALHVAYRNAKTAVEAATTKEELEAIKLN